MYDVLTQVMSSTQAVALVGILQAIKPWVLMLLGLAR